MTCPQKAGGNVTETSASILRPTRSNQGRSGSP